ncbi:EAL domain-containing protein [Curvibacter sp. APW13]|uniref:bifunctional diguanylate cyclase/phosphodiesterase n=1 Tax=Curvibacter sp. APW13 TaxID=3077236 RepID=UPI0028DE669C|nr:EAL domain-containing protein [Curvibacter sp. APW13]MDT8990587.1 EAL domain-containing protein [Curvibacter sp. APW13]
MIRWTARALQASARRHGVFLLAMAVLVGGSLSALGYMLWRLHDQALRQAESTLQVHARNFEEQLTQALQVIALTAINLDAAVAARDDSSELNRRLTYAVKPLPYVRSLSVVDAKGRILASSSPRNVGQQISLSTFYPGLQGPSDVLRVGLAWTGRDIANAFDPNGQAAPARSDFSFIPVLRTIPSDTQTVWLLATLNSDYFINSSLQMLRPEHDHLDWFRYDGLLLLSNDADRALNVHDTGLALEQRVAQSEQGVIAQSRHAGTGASVMSAYRTSSRFPLIVSVHTHRDAITQLWAADAGRIATVVLPILLGLVVAGIVIHRRRLVLQQQQQLAATVFESSPDAIIVTDAQARIISVNAASLSVTGYRSEELIGNNPRMLGSGQHPPAFYQALWHSVHTTGHWHGKLSNRRKDGTVYTALLEINAVYLPDGSLRHYTGLLQDITAQESAQQRLQIAAGVFDHAAEGIMITDMRGNILDVNSAFSQITGYARDEVVGRSTRLLSSGHQPKEFYAQMWAALRDAGQWSGEVVNRRKDGEVYAEHLAISTVSDAQGKSVRYVALFSDITEKKRQEHRLLQIAHYDALTGLPNRVLLSDRLRQAMAHTHRTRQPLAVLFLDLDGFKSVNDKHGHEAGDQLLVELAQRMRKALRENDTLSRIGGDEFVAVLTGVASADGCIPLLDRLIHCAAQPFEYHGQLLRVSASVGVTVYPQPEEVDAEQLMRQADQAMYQAKVAGKNRYHFFDTLQDSDVRSRHLQLQNVRAGLARSEFVLYYQPKVNMRTGALLGLEALIRWQHPERGLLSPIAFLPFLHNHPMALELGRWVLGTALAQVAQWQQEGRKVAVSVNIDPLHLQSERFVQELQEMLARHPNVAPEQLELEVLESSAMDDVSQVTGVIQRCRSLGVRFALDDFGTGYSSLNHLRHLPVQTVKVDQSFVRGILDSADDLAILQGVIGLSTAFQRTLVAEGVETRAHGALLLQQGCEGGQGYAIAHPMPAGDVWHWQQNWRPEFEALEQAMG